MLKEAAAQAGTKESPLATGPRPMTGAGTAVREPFARLQEVDSAQTESMHQSLMNAISASFTRIDVFEPSAWSKLIPALFAIVSVHKPRRYVELGVHNGMSFFAACQISQALNLNTECVAIDSWLGDDHANFHAPEIFTKFVGTLEKKYPSQYYMRSFFSEALEFFEDGSIDLLHIDGLHYYESVREDFESWLPKMTNKGVILFHDTNVHERNFGVWRFWQEIEKKYPSINLRHCHGLGVLYVGSENNNISRAFDLLRESEEYFPIAQQYLERLGDLQIENLEYRQHMDDLLRKKNADLLQLWGERLHNSQRGPLSVFRTRSARRKIIDSGLFDVQYYLETYPDVKQAQTDAISHFIMSGASELRNPSANFSTINYLLNYPDVLKSADNPLVHYIEFGMKEGRAPR